VRFLRRNTIALLALFIALSGTTYAASTLARNSVGTAQLKNGAVTKKKINKKTIKALKGNRGPRGLTGAQGAPGAPGAKGATGAQGLQGPKGEDLTFTTTLKSGQTLTGAYSAAGNSGFGFETIEFHPRLPADIPPANWHYLTSGTTTDCPGAGQAAPGHLCVYQAYASNATFGDFTDPYSTGAGVKPIGTVLWWTMGASGFVRGNWAVQPPAGFSATTVPAKSAKVSPAK
jgi:hypothetical protein